MFLSIKEQYYYLESSPGAVSVTFGILDTDFS